MSEFDTPQVNVRTSYSLSVYHTRECNNLGERHIDATEFQLETLRECEVCQNGQATSNTSVQECPFCAGEFARLPSHLPCEAQP